MTLGKKRGTNEYNKVFKTINTRNHVVYDIPTVEVVSHRKQLNP